MEEKIKNLKYELGRIDDVSITLTSAGVLMVRY